MIPEGSAETTLSVSIVVHESCLTHLDATLRSLAQALADARECGVLAGATVTVLDNASSEVYRRQLQQSLTVVRGATELALQLVLHPENRGFGAGHNVVQRSASAPMLLILNPDVELASDALLSALDWLRSHGDVAALNPHAIDGDGHAAHLCKRYPSVLDLLLRGQPIAAIRRPFARRLARYDYRDLDQRSPATVELLSGACLLCRREAFVNAGGFDESYFLYFEDFDLSLRLAQYGRLVYLPSMRILHRGGHTARKGLRHIGWFLRSALRFFNRHGWRLR